MALPKNLQLPPIQIQFSEKESGGAPTDIQVTRLGVFYSDYYGKIEISQETLRNFVRNFDAKVKKIDLAIDYSHNAHDIAAGWIEAVYLKNNDTELWARVKWTPEGEKKLNDKEFRYVSVDFDWEYTDNETLMKHGPTLNGAGLTNRPLVKGMEPTTALTELTNERENEMKTIQELTDENRKLSEQNSELQKQAAKLSEVTKENEGLKTKVDAQEKEIKDMKDKAALSEKEVAFQKLLDDGKAVPAQKEAYMKGDVVKFSELAAKPNYKGQGHGEDPAEGDMDADDAADKITQLAEKLVKEGKHSQLHEAIKQVRRENPDLVKALN